MWVQFRLLVDQFQRWIAIGVVLDDIGGDVALVLLDHFVMGQQFAVRQFDRVVYLLGGDHEARGYVVIDVVVVLVCYIGHCGTAVSDVVVLCYMGQFI